MLLKRNPTKPIAKIKNKNYNIGMEFYSKSIEDTYYFAEMIAQNCVGGEIILLNGDLGAGKTTFTKGFAKAIGVQGVVTSPTFTLMKTYIGKSLKLFHFDLYRINDENELEELGLSDYFNKDGVCIVEWNKFKKLNGKIIKINFSYEGEGRKIVLED